MLTREETNIWNLENEHYICSSLLEPNYKYDHYFRVLCDEYNKYYAFDQGCLINDIGCNSYRSALRRNILRNLMEAVKDNKFCAVVKCEDYVSRPYIEIVDKGNMARIINRYVYCKLMAKYGNTEYVKELHDIIDDWNQVETTCNDITRVNPRQIFISLVNDMTFQKLHLNKDDPNYQLNDTPIFYNGVPIDALEEMERVIYDGMVIGEINHGPAGLVDKESQLDFVAEMILDNGPSYTKISSDRQEFTREIDEARVRVLRKRRTK